MKRIYLLMVAALGLSTAASAQTFDMEFVTAPPAGGLVVTSPDGDETENEEASANNTYFMYFINKGTDPIMASDTIKFFVTAHVAATGSGIKFDVGAWTNPVGSNLAPGDSIALVFNPFAISTIDFGEISADQTENLCDTSWVVSSTGATRTEPTANNESCNNVNMHYWALNVNDVKTVSTFVVYPNPAANVLNVAASFNGAKNATVIVRDVVGRTVISENLGSNLNGTKKSSIDISNLANGMYIVELNADGKKQVKQISVQK